MMFNYFFFLKKGSLNKEFDLALAGIEAGAEAGAGATLLTIALGAGSLGMLNKYSTLPGTKLASVASTL